MCVFGAGSNDILAWGDYNVEGLFQCASPRKDFQLFLHNGFDMFGAKRASDELVELSRRGGDASETADELYLIMFIACPG